MADGVQVKRRSTLTRRCAPALSLERERVRRGFFHRPTKKGEHEARPYSHRRQTPPLLKSAFAFRFQERGTGGEAKYFPV